MITFPGNASLVSSALKGAAAQSRATIFASGVARAARRANMSNCLRVAPPTVERMTIPLLPRAPRPRSDEIAIMPEPCCATRQAQPASREKVARAPERGARRSARSPARCRRPAKLVALLRRPPISSPLSKLRRDKKISSSSGDGACAFHRACALFDPRPPAASRERPLGSAPPKSILSTPLPALQPLQSRHPRASGDNVLAAE